MAEEKLFRLPGTIEEEDECDRDLHMHDGDHQQQRPESPLLAQRSINRGGVGSGGGGSGGGHHSHHHHLHLPKNVTLLRVGTNASSIAGISRHDSSRYVLKFSRKK
ncbi:hypothetical protein QAD02_006009 [Eretmocerus hayati]|uniref:Uncharacterized protein n=1 Tax=Eretmocerus hayati TaxID=131215 RepID=A0ACC2N1Y6_9HYME|nr:hypothetical protein QAD02_006009 [Eretmocerus hayati]